MARGNKAFILPDNYIYISHLGDDGKYFILPLYPDSIQDNMSSTFASENALSRSAPIYTYSYSGPREVQITLDLHRDMMDNANQGVSNVVIDNPGDDYVDTLIKALQAISVPKYNITNKAVEPPLVAVRFGKEVFIKGIVNGGISLVYEKPLIQTANGVKYAKVQISFRVSETTPYDASGIAKNGSFRGLVRGMKAGFGLEE